MVVEARIEIRGIRELSAGFHQLEGNIPRAMKTRMRSEGQRIADRAAGGLPHVTGRAAGSIKPVASAQGVGISFGGASAPYEPWLDFGGSVGRGGATKLPFVQGGRYVYPAISAEGAGLEKAGEDAVADAAKGAGFEVR